VTSIPSDNMSKIITHQFEKDYNQHMKEKIDKERDFF
jgi:hypothetical protein